MRLRGTKHLDDACQRACPCKCQHGIPYSAIAILALSRDFERRLTRVALHDIMRAPPLNLLGNVSVDVTQHPGHILREQLRGQLRIEVTEAAHRLGVSRSALSRVLNGRAGISADFALKLESAGFGKAQEWVSLQSNFDLSKAWASKHGSTGA
jgi:antitoxin HigA-1